jgi:phosphoglycerate dehydrogenase-like enzyme/sugar phosphate isomerase/epimerase
VKFGFSTLGDPGLSYEDARRLAEEFGLQFIELRGLEGTLDLPAYFRAHPLPARNPGVTITGLGTSFHLEDGSPAAFEECLAFAELADRMGVPFIRIFAAADNKRPAPAQMTRDAAMVQRLRAELQARGLAVELLLETHGGYSFSSVCVELNRQLEQPLAILWDSHHTWKIGGETLEESWKLLGPQVRHVHYKDSVRDAADPAKYHYVLPGAGEFPTTDLLDLLRRENYRAGVSLEWEKKWHPEIPPLREALGPFRDIMRGAGDAAGEKNHRLLIALNQAEKETCAISLPGPIAGKVQARWFDPSGDPEADWAKTLADFQPTVLVTGWSTRPLPESYVGDPGCRLEYVCHLFGSVRALVPRAFLERGGCVTNWGDAVAAQVAEHALLLALGALRNMKKWDGFIRERGEAGSHSTVTLGTRTLFGRKVGLHGFGRIARELVKLLKPFGVTISAYSDGVPGEFIREHGVTPAGSLEQVFAGSDVLFECEALTPGTAGTVTARVLAALPDHAVFVNVGRGRVVDEEALLREAASGRIRVALDVVIEEPLTAQSPAAKIPDALLSPHIAGPTFDRYPRLGAAALENVARYISRKPLESVVTLRDYDRST